MTIADKKRASHHSVEYLLTQFPCVALLGPRQAGKSTLLRQVLPKAKFFDLEKDSDFSRISADPEFFLQDNSFPLILDEAQLCPELLAALRVKIHANRKQNGQYLISGSFNTLKLNSKAALPWAICLTITHRSLYSDANAYCH